MTKVIRNGQKALPEWVMKLIPFILALALWCTLTFREQYFLKKVEDLSVFLFDRQFILESLRIPGGILGLAGSFLTQFLHFPWFGALIWVSLLLLAYFLTIRTFRIPSSMSALALIPVALLVIGNMSLGYGVFIMRFQDHFFSPVLGYLAALIPLGVINRSRSLLSKIVFTAIWLIAGYPIIGVYAITGAIAAACAELSGSESLRKQRFTLLLFTLALAVLVPIVIYPLYTSYRLTDSWTLGLPSISEATLTRTVRAPFMLAFLCQILFGSARGKLSAVSLSAARKTTVQSVLLIVSVASVWGFWFKDDNFRTELSMTDAVDRYDWSDVVRIYTKAADVHSKSDAKAYASRTKKLSQAKSKDEISAIVDSYSKRFFEPTRTMVMYRDLALLKTGRALDEAFTMMDGGRPQKTRYQVPMAYQSGKQFYFQYGLENMCYRWCMEDIIEHGWSFSTLKYMVEYAILTGEYSLATKHIDKLSKTLFYRKWARSRSELVSAPESIAHTEPYKGILPYLCFEDNMSNDMGKTELYVINHFLNDRTRNATVQYNRAALLFAMRTQSIPKFWECLINYIGSSNDIHSLPRSVQEAALLYRSLEKTGVELIYDNSVKEGLDSFNKYVSSHPIRDMKESLYPFRLKFGKTFQYYYYFIRNLHTY